MERRLVCQAVLGTAFLGWEPLRALAASGEDAGDAHRQAVTVSFGAGLNTAQPGNAANHHILPHVIQVRRGGVVNFVVAGLHQIMVYFPGVTPETIAVPPPTSFFINDNNNLYYRGIAPAGGPPPATAATVNPSNAENRVESVSFSEPGDYLVICNVRPHFLDGMHAVVQVR
jgi:plastocyanin